MFVRKLIITFLHYPVPVETNDYFPATAGPRLTQSQEPTGKTTPKQSEFVFVS